MKISDLTFAFLGTPDVASETLEILKLAGILPKLIVTAPDKPKGRKMILSSPPAKKWAEENNITVLQPEKLDDNFIESLKTRSWDLFIVVAYGKIIPQKVLDIPKLGSINVHYSLLPKYRGASPVESAILLGEKETGVTIQKIAFKMDAGNILAVEKVRIDDNEKAPGLRKRLIKIGGDLLVKILPEFLEGKIKEIIQNEAEATVCKKIKKEDGLVDLENENGEVLYNKFRAYAAWPRIFFFHHNKRVLITDASLEDDKFIIKKVLPEGKKEISYDIFTKNYSG